MAWAAPWSGPTPSGTTTTPLRCPPSAPLARPSPTGGSRRVRAAVRLEFDAVSGHRDAGSTGCPGAAVYARLGTIRSLTSSQWEPRASMTMRRTSTSAWTPDLVARSTSGEAVPPPGDRDRLRELPARRAGVERSGPVRRRRRLGPRPRLARRRSDGTFRLYAEDGNGGLHPGRQIGVLWNSIDALMAAGDWDGDGDGATDVVARHNAGRAYLYPRKRNGAHGKPRRALGVWPLERAGMSPSSLPAILLTRSEETRSRPRSAASAARRRDLRPGDRKPPARSGQHGSTARIVPVVLTLQFEWFDRP